MMKRITLSFVALLALSAPALAVCPSTLQVKDNLAATGNVVYNDNGSGNCIPSVTLQSGANAASVTASNALKVDGSAVTQPISGNVGQSGTWTVQPGNTANTTPWLVTGSGSAGSAATGVLTIQGISSMTPILANPGTAANWGIGTSTQNSATVSNGQLALAQFNTTPTTITSGNMSPLQMDSAGNLLVNIKSPTFNGNGAATAANSSPSVIAIDQVPSTTGNIVANNTTAVVVNAAATTVYGAQLFGIGSAPAYVKIYNATSATCGSGTPVKRLMIPAASTAANGAGDIIPFPLGFRLSTGFTYCVTTGIGDADTTAPAASTYLVNFDWR